MDKYIIVINTLCEGWQASERDETGSLITYATEAEARAEIQDCLEELNNNRIESGEEPYAYEEENCDGELMAVPLSEFVPGRKSIFYPQEVKECVTVNGVAHCYTMAGSEQAMTKIRQLLSEEG